MDLTTAHLTHAITEEELWLSTHPPLRAKHSSRFRACDKAPASVSLRASLVRHQSSTRHRLRGYRAKADPAFELTRLLHRQSDEGAGLRGTGLISSWKDSFITHAHHSHQAARAMLTCSCTGFVVKESSVVGRFRQRTASLMGDRVCTNCRGMQRAARAYGDWLAQSFAG